MSLQDVRVKLGTNLDDIYTALQEKSATIPEQKNLVNVAPAVRSITGGSSSGQYVWAKYSDYEKDENIKLLMPFDRTTEDLTKNNIPTVVGGNSYGEGKFGQARYFNGSTDYISMPYTEDINVDTGDFTIAFWAYVNASNTTRVFFEILERVTSGIKGLRIGLSENNVIYCVVCTSSTGSSLVITNTDKTITNDTWTHIALVRKGALFYFYVNGELVKSTEYSGNLYNGSKVMIGARHIDKDTAMPFVGYIDDLIISKSALWDGEFTPPTEPFKYDTGTFEGYVVADDENAYPSDDYAEDGYYYKKGYGEDVNTSLFTRIAYLESTGTQCIDTNYVPNNTTRIEMVFEFTKTHTEHGWIFGARNGYLVDDFSVAWHTGANEFYNAFGTDLQYMKSCQANIIYKLVKNRNITTINGVSATSPDSIFNSGYSMFLFALHNVEGAFKPAFLKIYSAKIYDNDVLIRDYIPALDENNIACLYDKVTKTYFYNQGTGSFNAGPIVE